MQKETGTESGLYLAYKRKTTKLPVVDKKEKVDVLLRLMSNAHYLAELVIGLIGKLQTSVTRKQ